MRPSREAPRGTRSAPSLSRKLLRRAMGRHRCRGVSLLMTVPANRHVGRRRRQRGQASKKAEGAYRGPEADSHRRSPRLLRLRQTDGDPPRALFRDLTLWRRVKPKFDQDQCQRIADRFRRRSVAKMQQLRPMQARRARIAPLLRPARSSCCECPAHHESGSPRCPQLRMGRS